MNADVLTTTVENAIAVITLGSAKRIYFDEEMGDSVTAALEELAGDPAVRVVVVTGGAPTILFVTFFSSQGSKYTGSLVIASESRPKTHEARRKR